jgi:hypothetical protein
LQRHPACHLSADLSEVRTLKHTYSAFTLKEALQLVSARRLLPWDLQAPPRPPSDVLKENPRRLEVFDLENTGAAKTLLIDALLAEIVPNHPGLKIWKAMPLETDTMTGVADYRITPDYAYPATPLLCVVEAKRDDFVQGRAQCIAEMVACQWNNRQEGHEIDIYGIVSNRQGWQFYRLTRTGEVYETDLFALQTLPELLGALDAVCAECARSVPATPLRRATLSPGWL